MATVHITMQGASSAYQCDDGERILFSGLRHGIPLPYECGSGTCGKCRAVVVEGAVKDLWRQAPAKQFLKSWRNEVLMCQTSAFGDVRLDVSRGKASGSLALTNTPLLMTGTISGCRRLTEDVLEVIVALERPLAFEAGQFVLIEFPGIEGFRAYSIVNYERPASTLTLIVRRKPAGGVSTWLFARDRGRETVKVFGPLGKAVFASDTTRSVLCIAGGTGIAGMMSIVRRASSEGHFKRNQGHVFFGVRRPEDLFYADELSAFRQEYPDSLEITVAFSEQQASPKLAASYPLLDFDEGFIHEVAVRKMQGRFADATAFLAGPQVAVDAGIRSLMSIGRVPLSRIRFDRFG